MENKEAPQAAISHQRTGSKFHIVRMYRDLISVKSYRFRRETLCGKSWPYQNERNVTSESVLDPKNAKFFCRVCSEKLHIEVVTYRLTK